MADAEIVGRFAGREAFAAAIGELTAAGFEHGDLSVLDTHESISAGDAPGDVWKESLSSLVGEIKYVGPLTAAGLIAIATGPMGMAIAGTMAAGITGVALHELLEKIRATPHTEAFARALEQGEVLLWVATGTPEQQIQASEILARHGAADVHVHRRAAS